MDSRKHAGRKADYLCSGLVYCACGAKMHGYKTTSRGHTYYRYVCSAHCGRPTVRMEAVDEAALEATEPPEDYTVDTIRQWLNALKNSPDEKAVRLLIERIDYSGDKKNNLFNIQSTLNRLLEKMVAGEGFEPTTSGL